MTTTNKVICRDVGTDADGFERIVMAEVIIPDVPNSYGDIVSREGVREFAYEFARQGYGIDINHDQEDRKGSVYVVESFIARAGDPDFIEGAWVVGMRIDDDDLWAQVLAGELNGYSYEAICFLLPVSIQNLRNRQIAGVTEPDPIDGHTHTYLVVLDAQNRPISGGTGMTNGHMHTISSHTTTDFVLQGVDRVHNHRYQVINVDKEEG